MGDKAVCWATDRQEETDVSCPQIIQVTDFSVHLCLERACQKINKDVYLGVTGHEDSRNRCVTTKTVQENK